MASRRHSDLIAPSAIHPAWYYDSADPGAVGAGKLWVQWVGTADAPTTLTVWQRNSTNLGWIQIHPTPQSALVQQYLGENTTGNLYAAMTQYKVWALKITMAKAGLLTNIEALIRNASSGTDDQAHSFHYGLYDDVAGTPGLLISGVQSGNNTEYSARFDAASGATGDNVGRWFGLPIGRWLAAGNYWITVMNMRTSPTAELYYWGGGGTGRVYTSTGPWMSDWGFDTPTTTSDRYCIRANVLT